MVFTNPPAPFAKRGSNPEGEVVDYTKSHPDALWGN